MNPAPSLIARACVLSAAVIAAALGTFNLSAQTFVQVPGVAYDLGELKPVTGSENHLGAFSIVLNPDAGLSANLPALAAFTRAANQWANYFTDPITVNINAGLAVLGSGIIGSTSSVLLNGPYDLIRDAMVADAADEPSNGIVASLPTAAQFSALLPDGFSLDGSITATKANLKAMGFAGLDGAFGAADAAVTFSSTFAFDYDNSDGVGAGLIDFETVAAHEIGHALGFISAVDYVDYLITQEDPGPVDLSPLDLYRFDSAQLNPTTTGEFTSYPRDLRTGGSPIFDDIAGPEYPFSTGVDHGDGRQASHWKDNLGIGIMDPTLANQEVELISAADLRAFDLIGYDLAVPEPSTYAAIGGLGAMLFLQWRRGRRQA